MIHETDVVYSTIANCTVLPHISLSVLIGKSMKCLHLNSFLVLVDNGRIEGGKNQSRKYC